MSGNHLHDSLKLGIIALGLGLLGGLTHNPADPIHYAQGALGLLHETDIYTISGVVYPPLLYALTAPVFWLLGHTVAPTTPASYTAIAVFAILGSTVHVTVYRLGKPLLPAEAERGWLFASLLNPFALFVTVLFGQMEVFIVLGVVGAIYGHHTGRYWVGGAALSLASAVKIYPVVLFIPYLVHHRAHSRRILAGGAPILAITGGLMLLLPNATAIFGASTASRPVSLLVILFDGGIAASTVDLVFKAALVISVGAAVILSLPDDLRLLPPLIPPALLYPNVIEYRWLPLAMGLLAVGYLTTDAKTEVRELCWRCGWIVTILGFTAMLTGTLEGWLEGQPWIVPITGTLPAFPVSIPLGVLGDARMLIALLVAVSVGWAGVRYVTLEWTRGQVPSPRK